MRVINGEGHQGRCLAAGVTEHQALVTGALIKVETLTFVDALCNIGRLAIDRGEDGAALVIETHLGSVVADTTHDLLSDLSVIDMRFGSNFAGNHDQPGRYHRFAGDAAVRIFGQDGVEDGVRYLVGDFVGMAFADRLRREKKLF